MLIRHLSLETGKAEGIMRDSGEGGQNCIG